MQIQLENEKNLSSSSVNEIKVKAQSVFESEQEESKDDNLTEGKWLQEENVKFIIFMNLHKDIFKSKEKRKAEKIFKNVSSVLKTRSPRQCRSHFQKLIKKFKTIFQMKKHYRDLLGHQKFDQMFEKLRIQLNRTSVKKSISEVKVKEVSIQSEPSEYSTFNYPKFSNSSEISQYFLYHPQMLYWSYTNQE